MCFLKRPQFARAAPSPERQGKRASAPGAGRAGA